MIIRNVVKNDVENIAKLYISNWKETYKDLLSKDFLESLNEEYATNKWFKYIEEGNSIFVVYDEEEFLGFVASKKDDDIENCWYLDSLHINRACRGKGIGTKLIKKVGQYAMHQGYEHMSICIVKGNDNAKNIYERLGAVHYKDFIDDFGGTKSNSQKLIWKDLSIFS